MSVLNVSVLRGGRSTLYDKSLAGGSHILKSLPPDIYNAADVFIDTSGKWHMRGVEAHPARVLRQTDVVFNALHGEAAENGFVQRILDTFSVCYTGVGALSAALSTNFFCVCDKGLSGIVDTQKFFVSRAGEDHDSFSNKIVQKVSPPFVVRTRNGWPRKRREAKCAKDLSCLIRRTLADTTAPAVIVEEYLAGRRLLCAVIERIRGKDYYVTPPAELSERPVGCNDAVEYCGEKYAFYSPARKMPADHKAAIEKICIDVFNSLGMRHYALFELVITKRGKIVLYDILSLPPLGKWEIFPMLLDGVGISMREFATNIIELALTGR